MTYPGFGKIPRLNRPIVATEKIDGSNGQIAIWLEENDVPDDVPAHQVGESHYIAAGSRKRWVTPQADNFGFASWVYANAEALVETLGDGTHWGEWWGSGIQRGYGLTDGERYFSLFNTSRWEGLSTDFGLRCVPVLWTGNMKHFNQEEWLQVLVNRGSFVVDGYMAPEGLIVFHAASNHLYKVTLVDDEYGKREIIGKGNGHGNVLKSDPVDGTW